MLWAKSLGMGAAPERPYSIADIWQMRDGDFITLTNRVVDLPAGFSLHPMEISGALLAQMCEGLANRDPLDEPIDGPNLWRVRAGDRVAWMGKPRAGASGDGNVLGIVTFRTDALVYGEPVRMTHGWPTFGVLSEPPLTDGPGLCRAGFEAILKAGLPRELALDLQWRLA
jgi:hypothetical protein